MDRRQEEKANESCLAAVVAHIVVSTWLRLLLQFFELLGGTGKEFRPTWLTQPIRIKTSEHFLLKLLDL